jgi:hypothetical protein
LSKICKYVQDYKVIKQRSGLIVSSFSIVVVSVKYAKRLQCVRMFLQRKKDILDKHIKKNTWQTLGDWNAKLSQNVVALHRSLWELNCYISLQEICICFTVKKVFIFAHIKYVYNDKEKGCDKKLLNTYLKEFVKTEMKFEEK